MRLLKSLAIAVVGLALSTAGQCGELRGVARAIDGDTIELGHTRIRLAGIDAAELGTPAGERARALMAQLVAGREVICDVRAWQPAKGHYPPRAIADCTVGGRDLAGALIGRGAGVAR